MKLFEVIYHCGAITKGLVVKYKEQELLEESIEKNLLEEKHIKIKGKYIYAYVFTNYGEKVFSEISGRNNFYRCINTRKAVRLSYVYTSLSEKEKKTWKNKEELLLSHPISQVPDAVYISGKEKTAVVVVSAAIKEKKLKELKLFLDNNFIKSVRLFSESIPEKKVFTETKGKKKQVASKKS